MPLTTDGPIFRRAGLPWRWRGVSAFQLLDHFAHGRNIQPFLAAYRGFNLLRVWPYVPVTDWGARAWDVADGMTTLAFLEVCAASGFYVELTLLTDDEPARLGWAASLVHLCAAAHVPNLLLEIGNEPTTHKSIDTAALRGVLEGSGFLFSSGDYEDSRRWFGSFLTAHTARDGEWPRKAHDLLDYYRGGGPSFPEEPACRVPIVADEPIRPDQAQGTPPQRVQDFVAYYGVCSLLGAGATFHPGSGRFGALPTPDERLCAEAALFGLTAFPAGAPLGPYARLVERSLRTYIVGDSMVRVRPETPEAPEPGWRALDPDGVLFTRVR